MLELSQTLKRIRACQLKPVCWYVRNPCGDASKRYGPVSRFGITYAPVPSVTDVRVKPVSVWVTETVTPGRTAPLSSRTVPLSCAVAWAEAGPAVSRRINAPSDRCVRDRSFLDSS